LEHAGRIQKERAERLYSLCGGKQRVDAVLNKLVSHNVKMTEQQIENYKPRWKGLKNFERTPGGFTEQDAADLFRSLFLN
jgi:hypothetical protein